MKTIKKKNREGSYNFEFIKDNLSFRIEFAGNLDLYFVLGYTDKNIKNEDLDLSFVVTKEDYDLYKALDILYDEVITGEIFRGDNDFPVLSNTSFKDTEPYNRLVDKNKNIKWVSDDGPTELEDYLTIKRIDDDSYELLFSRNSLKLDFGFKNPYGITVRFRNSGSMYDPFNCSFMRMFRRIQAIDPDYHQIHIEEYEYQKRIGKVV